MITQGIVIPWVFSDEYIKVDFNEIKNKPIITHTIDVSRKSSKMLKLMVISKWEGPNPENQYRLTLSYNEENNTHIIENNNSHISEDDKMDTFWGEATIVINPRDNTGNASWRGFKNSNWDGTVNWKKKDEALFGERKKERVSRIKRQQSQLRQALLTLDTQCVICGEDLPEVLEAAHIIAVSDGGKEVIENAILLRADLHRLLDAELISIDSGGLILINSTRSLPQKYKDLLKDKKISDGIFNRIMKAIEYRNTKKQI